jgi:hypothetical protein
MDQIKIILLPAESQREISISPTALRESISPVLYLVFAEDHTADKLFGPSSAIDIRIVFLKETFEMLIMMVSKFHEHQQVRVVFTDHILYSRIVGIVLMDISEEDFERTSGGGLLYIGIGIEISELRRID